MSLGIKEKMFVSLNCPQLRATGAEKQPQGKHPKDQLQAQHWTFVLPILPEPSPGTGHLLQAVQSAWGWLIQQREPWIHLKSHPQGART